jgi:hypothetical protein
MAAYSPQITAQVGALAFQELGRQVRRGAHDEAGAREIAIADVLGDAEVAELHFAATRDHDVRRLDVAVNDAAEVGVLEGARDAERDDERDVRRQALRLADQLADVLAVDVLEDHVRLAVLHDEVVDADDVLVLERRERARLAVEALGHVAVVRDLREHHLDGDGAPERRLGAVEDLGHAALAEGALDARGAEDAYPLASCQGARLYSGPHRAFDLLPLGR